jgi:hypothetical protein
MSGTPLELAPGEALLAHVRVSFRGAAAASMRATFALGSARMRQKAFETWRQTLDSAHVPSAGPEMSLALSDRRLYVCHTTFWFSRPSQAAGGIGLSRIAETAVVRNGLVTSLALVIDHGAIIEFEAMRHRAVRRFAHALDEARAPHQY